MATSKARPTTRAGSKKKLSGIALGLAIAALKNPLVHDRLINMPSAAASHLRSWRKEREDRVASATRISRLKGIADRFGQAGLERRSQRLRETMQAMEPVTARDEALRDAVVKVVAALDVIDVQLRVAGSLPAIKRKRAHSKIDDALDELESAMWDAVSPKSES